MGNYTIMLKPASGLCNIRCQYCFYADLMNIRELESYGRMNRETIHQILENVFHDLTNKDSLTIIFQGGEPTLAGKKFFRELLAYVEEIKTSTVSYSIQTNGMVIDDEWCELFVEHDFLVGLSLDGNDHFHNLYRKDTIGNGTFKKVMAAKKLFDKYQIRYNILSVLTNQMAKHPVEIFKFIKKHNISYTQFIPCLGDLEDTEENQYTLTPENFAYFYQQIYHLWEREIKNGHYYSIKLIDDIGNLLSKGTVGVCGMLGSCSPQIVVEADGTVFPCDFYMTDAYKIGNLRSDSFKTLLQKSRGTLLQNVANARTEKCDTCPYLAIFNGGCKRMKDVMFWDAKQHVCGYREVLSRTAVPLMQLLREYH